MLIAVATLMIKGKTLLNERKEEVANQATPIQDVLSVPVVKTTQGVMHQKVPFLAQILSDKSIRLSTKLTGYIKRIAVSESQKVKKGEILVHIDATELQSNIDALKATLSAQQNDVALAQSIHNRNIKLHKIGGLSKEQLDISRVALKMKHSVAENTRQKIVQLEHQLTYLQIVAPFDGEIDAIFMHEGDLAATGKPILSMSNGKKKLVFSYAPTQKNLIQQGQMVLSGKRKIGEIKAIYTTSNNGLVTAETTLDIAVDLPVGSSMQIDVLTQSQTGCILPDTTILHKKDGTFVMLYAEGKFSPFKVKVEMSENSHVMISPCPERLVANASEVKLATLPAYNNIEVSGVKDE